MEHINYKHTDVRVVPANGRHIVEVLVGGTSWVTAVIRERLDTATNIADGLRELLRVNDDDVFSQREREANAELDKDVG